MQDIRIHDSASAEKKPLNTTQPGVVKMYVCGVTVYDYCHIGHARVMVFFDVVNRFLKHCGYNVNYVRNITDVDDKIIAKSQQDKINYTDLTEKYIQAMHEDEARLGNLSPDYEPKASDNINNMIDLIKTLINKEHAYVKEDGSVWFRAKSYENYGTVSGQDINALISGIRKEVASEKEDALDFILWKPVKPGEPSWDSPWGSGRPGWHIECSAMASSYLGFTLDIHGGGVDLKFPHHENESAQSCCAYDAVYVKRWMHVGHVTTKSEKMSKSLGNFLTIRDALNLASGEAVRYLLLTSHYRQPMPFDPENLPAASKAISRFYRVMKKFPPIEIERPDSPAVEEFYNAMADDFNTVKAFAVCFDLVKQAYNAAIESEHLASSYTAELKYLLRIMGFAMSSPDKYLTKNIDISVEQIQAYISERDVARSKKNWQLADSIREQLLLEGIVLEDGPDGTTWRSV